ncbi:MAG: AAA family ATPase, partial [Prolixibacteraceae bacterium]|nr:AAA family ATPase [Prolixibacteraceae bacterium]
MERKIIDRLIHWKNSPDRKPLILNGARQVGKTYILKEFATTYYDKFVYINFETNSRINSFFDGDLNPLHIIQYLELVSDIRIFPG